MGGGCGAIFVHRKWLRMWWWCAAHGSVVCSTARGRLQLWAVSIMVAEVAEELPHLIQPVAEAWTADRSLISKRTRQRVCEEWFGVAMVTAQWVG